MIFICMIYSCSVSCALPCYVRRFEWADASVVPNRDRRLDLERGFAQAGRVRGFDGRKRHLVVDAFGLVVARRVEAANVSDQRAGARLLAGLGSGFPRIRTVMADAGYESRKLARELKRRHGWQLQITQRRQRAFKVAGLTWIVERTFAWLGRNRRLSKDYEFKVQTSEAFIDLAAIRLMLRQVAPR